MGRGKDDLIYGIHPISAVMKFAPERVKTLSIQEGKKDPAMDSAAALARKIGVPVRRMTAASLEKLTKSKTHQGIVATVLPAQFYREQDLGQLVEGAKAAPLVLVLDEVQDPHNFGACLRTADACGVDFVMVAKAQSVGLTPVVHKVSCGASQSMPIVQVSNLVRGLSVLKDNGLWVLGAAAEAQESLYQVDFTAPTAIVLGSEGSGLRQSVSKQCDRLISIPMSGYVGSLNISVANGVCLYECVRQRTA